MYPRILISKNKNKIKIQRMPIKRFETKCINEKERQEKLGNIFYAERPSIVKSLGFKCLTVIKNVFKWHVIWIIWKEKHFVFFNVFRFNLIRISNFK